MGAGDDFFFTGGGFSDWSGGSAGKFSSGGSSSGGGGSNQPEPNDWKYGCGCLVVVVAIILYFGLDTIYYKWFYDEDITVEYADTTAEQEDTIMSNSYEPQGLPASVCPAPEDREIAKTSPSSRTNQSSRTYYYDDDDEYDEDGMYKDEDEDIKDKRQYDDYDDDEADDWE